MQTLPVHGYDMAYLEIGTGRPLVCVHGTLGDFRTWSAVMGPLSKSHRVITVSLRRFFPEHWDGVGSDYLMAQHVADMIGFLERLGDGPVDLMGHSRGGHISFRVAQQRPDLLHRLVLFRLRGRALALAIAISVVVMGGAAAYAGSFDVGSRPEDMLLALPRLMLAYLIGIAICHGWGDRTALAVPPLPALAAMPGLLVLAWWCGVTSWLFDMAFVVVACPLMIAGAMRLRIAAIGVRWASFAGAWSFPLYAIHFPLLIQLRNGGATAWQAALAALAVSALATGLELQLRAQLEKAGSWRTMIVGLRRTIIRSAIAKDVSVHGPILHR